MAENENKVVKNKDEITDPKHPAMHHEPMVGLWITIGLILFLIFAGGTFMVMRRVMVGNSLRKGVNRVEMMNGSARGFGRGGMMRGFGLNDGLKTNEASGKVTAVNDKQFTMTVNSTSKTVQISDTTRFPNTSATKVAVGDTVLVVGQQDSNGVIQATEIAVNLSN